MLGQQEEREQQYRELDASTVRYLAAPAVEAAEEISKVNTNGYYRPEEKRAMIREIGEAAALEIDRRMKAELEQLDAAQEQWKKDIYVSPTPTPEEAAQLVYVKDVLFSRLQKESPQAMAQLWETAIERGDKTTVKIFYDFGREWLTSQPPQGTATLDNVVKRAAQTQHGISSAFLKRLEERSLELLATKTQLEATRNLQGYQTRRLEIGVAARAGRDHLANTLGTPRRKSFKL